MHHQCTDNHTDYDRNGNVNALFTLVLRERISRTTPQRCKVTRLIYNTLSQLLTKWQLLLVLSLMFLLLHTLCCFNSVAKVWQQADKMRQVKISKIKRAEC